MGADCCDPCDLSDPHRGNAAYRRLLWAVLAINAVTFAVEVGAGLAAGSAALQADALDFLGDAAKASTMAGTEPPPAECPLLGRTGHAGLAGMTGKPTPKSIGSDLRSTRIGWSALWEPLFTSHSTSTNLSRQTSVLSTGHSNI